MDTQTAAGSLFTSCVTNTEPQGIKDIREAKANYLDALAELRKADAELVKAQKAYADAKTAWETEANRIANALAQANLDKTTADNEAYIAKLKADLEKDLVVKAQQLAEAEESLRQALVKIELQSTNLTKEEKTAVEEYTRLYKAYLAAVEKVRKAEASLYNASVSREEYVEGKVLDSIETAESIAYYEEFLANLPDSGASIGEWAVYKDLFDQQTAELEFEKANIKKEWQIYQSTEVSESIKGFAEGLLDHVARNAALPAPFIMNYKAQLPDNEQVCKLLKKYVDEYHGFRLFSNNTTTLDYLYNNLHIEKDTDGTYWVVANFTNAPYARYVIWGEPFQDKEVEYDDFAGFTGVIEALSRELVVDSTKAAYDTTGMKAAVAKADKEYNETLATLTAGVEDYPKYTEAIAAYTKAKNDSTVAKEALDAALDSLQSKWKALVETYEEIDFEEALSRIEISALNTVDDEFETSIKDFAVARAAYFGVAANAKDGHSLDSIKVFESIGREQLKPAYWALKDLASKDYANGGDGTYYNAFYEGTYTSVWECRKAAYNFVLNRLLPLLSDKGNWVERERDYFSYGIPSKAGSFHFSTPVIKNGKIDHWDAYKYVAKDSKNPSNYVAVSDEKIFFTPANLVGKYNAQFTARKEFYEKFYCNFWGIAYKTLEANPNFDPKEIKFKNKQDSLDVNFTVKTFVDAKKSNIVSFELVNEHTPNYQAKDKKFYCDYEGNTIEFEHNPQMDIVMQQLTDNHGFSFDVPTAYNFYSNTLIGKTLFKEFVLASVSTDTQGTKESFAELEKIAADIKEAYKAARDKQHVESADFYKFIAGLVGQNFIDSVCNGIDKACKKVAGYIPAYVDGMVDQLDPRTKRLLDYAAVLVSGKKPSQEIILAIFEDFMCGEFGSMNVQLPKIFKNAGSLDELTRTLQTSFAIERKPIDNWTRYALAYITLQFGDAAIGTQFRQVLSDVLTAYISYVVDGETENYWKTGDNAIETILFGTIQYAKIFDEDETGQANRSGKMYEAILEKFMPFIVPYVVSDLGGKIGELSEIYFSEWQEAWNAYEEAIVAVNAKIKAVANSKAIYDNYFDSIGGKSGLLAIEKEIYDILNGSTSKDRWGKEIKVEGLYEHYAKVCKELATIAAGADKDLDTLETAKKALAEAQAELDEAATMLEIAQRLYEQVLANHGLAE